MYGIQEFYTNQSDRFVDIKNKNLMHWHIQQGLYNYYSKQFNIISYMETGFTVVMQVLDSKNELVETVCHVLENSKVTLYDDFEKLKNKYIGVLN
jgi:hypothetical protein